MLVSIDQIRPASVGDGIVTNGLDTSIVNLVWIGDFGALKVKRHGWGTHGRTVVLYHAHFQFFHVNWKLICRVKYLVFNEFQEYNLNEFEVIYYN